jgi:DNA-binding NtrC family response regulator
MADTQASRLANHGLAPGGEYLSLARAAHAKSAGSPLNLLVVDDDEHVRDVCHAVALESGMKPMEVSTAEEALEVMEVLPADILLTDLRLPGTSGLELLKKVTLLHPDLAVVMLTQYGTIDSAVEATRIGAADYVTKPFRLEELRARLEHVAPGTTHRVFEPDAAL